VQPVPGRKSIYRALVRNGLMLPGQRKRRRADYRRWERARPMELWQMDVVGGFHLADGTELKAVSGIDDSSRFVVSAMLVPRATATPVCEALLAALRRHGIPEQNLTDIQSGWAISDRICRPAVRGSGRPAPARRRFLTDWSAQRLLAC
jgi:transposase InsO family protein